MRYKVITEGNKFIIKWKGLFGWHSLRISEEIDYSGMYHTSYIIKFDTAQQAIDYIIINILN